MVAISRIEELRRRTRVIDDNLFWLAEDYKLNRRNDAGIRVRTSDRGFSVKKKKGGVTVNVSYHSFQRRKTRTDTVTVQISMQGGDKVEGYGYSHVGTYGRVAYQRRNPEQKIFDAIPIPTDEYDPNWLEMIFSNSPYQTSLHGDRLSFLIRDEEKGQEAFNMLLEKAYQILNDEPYTLLCQSGLTIRD